MAMKELLNPFRYGFLSLQLISHKVLRYLGIYVLGLLFFSNYLLALYGWIKRDYVGSRLVKAPLFICLRNLSAFLGAIKFLAHLPTNGLALTRR
jgi:hypothetical protein